MSLLTIVQDAQDLLQAEQRLTSVIGNTTPGGRHMRVLAQKAGEALVKVHPWTALMTTRTRTTTATETQSAFLSTNYDRLIDETMWNITRQRRVLGPLTPREYSAAKALNTSLSTQAFRKQGTSILLWPVPGAGEQIRYEYVAADFVMVSAGTFSTTWAADTNTAVIPERLFTLWIVWKWKAGKGLEYQEEMGDFQLALAEEIAADGGRRTLNAASGGRGANVFAPGVPEGSWPL